MPLFHLLVSILFGGAVATAPSLVSDDLQKTRPWSFDQGGVIRGDSSKKELALIFTGGDFGEGTAHILDVLRDQRIHASFFVTGDFLRKPEYLPLIQRAIKEGHYVGPHSDRHPLYCPWEDRGKSLLSEDQFRS